MCRTGRGPASSISCDAPCTGERAGPTEALERVEAIRDLSVGELPRDHLPPNRLRALARYGAAARAQAIARMTPERRSATLLAFARAFEYIAMDDASIFGPPDQRYSP